MEAFLYGVDVLFIIVAVFLILLVLIQKGRGGGLSSAFGGGAGGHTAFGSKTGDVLTWATSIVFGVFLLLAVAANLVFSKVNAQQRPPTGVAAPAGSPEENGAPTPGPTTGPAVPGSPSSSLPQAPQTADPGVAHAPPATVPTTSPLNR